MNPVRRFRQLFSPRRLFRTTPRITKLGARAYNMHLSVKFHAKKLTDWKYLKMLKLLLTFAFLVLKRADAGILKRWGLVRKETPHHGWGRRARKFWKLDALDWLITHMCSFTLNYLSLQKFVIILMKCPNYSENFENFPSSPLYPPLWKADFLWFTLSHLTWSDLPRSAKC